MTKGINKRSEFILENIIYKSLLDALYNHNRYRIGTKFDFDSIRIHALMAVDEIDKKCNVRRRRGSRGRCRQSENTTTEIERKNKRFRDAQVRQLIRSAGNSTKVSKSIGKPKYY